MTQKAAPEEVDALLAKANGPRRARTLSWTEVERLVSEAAASPIGVAFGHGGSSDPRARTTLCLVVVEEDRVTAGFAELSAVDADPGKAWKELRPWNAHLPEANVARARAWAARKKPDRVRWKLDKPQPVDGEGLLPKILEKPGDDQLRLVYADWLAEQGDPRGELIAIQIRRAQEEQGGKQAPALRQRELQLWESEPIAKLFKGWLGFEWAPVLLDEGVTVARGQGQHGAEALWFRRGFVDGISVQATKLSELTGLMTQEPVEQLSLYTSGPPDGARIAALPGLSRVRKLSLMPLRAIQPDGLSLLLESRELRKLESLELVGQSMLEVGALLLAARGPEVLPALEELTVIDDALTATALSALRSTRWFRRLKALKLEAVALRPAAITALADGPEVEWESLALERDGLGANDVLPLFRSKALAKVKRLSLAKNNLSNVAALLATPLLSTLQQLSLNGNPLTESARQVLRARLNDKVLLD